MATAHIRAIGRSGKSKVKDKCSVRLLMGDKISQAVLCGYAFPHIRRHSRKIATHYNKMPCMMAADFALPLWLLFKPLTYNFRLLTSQ